MANKAKRRKDMEGRSQQRSSLTLPVEISLPFEFIVYGAPATLQSSPERKKEWQEEVRATAKSERPSGTTHLAWNKQVRARIWYYFVETPADCDIDNIIKPILDACNRIVYQDDKFVSDVCSHRFDTEKIPADLQTPLVIDAVRTKSDFVHIRFEHG